VTLEIVRTIERSDGKYLKDGVRSPIKDGVRSPMSHLQKVTVFSRSSDIEYQGHGVMQGLGVRSCNQV